jgi:hypothetical protein
MGFWVRKGGMRAGMGREEVSLWHLDVWGPGNWADGWMLVAMDFAGILYSLNPSV